MNLKEWAAATGISYATARRRYESGTLPVPTYRLGRLIMVGQPLSAPAANGQAVVYARVSSAERKGPGLSAEAMQAILAAAPRPKPVLRWLRLALLAVGLGQFFLGVAQISAYATTLADHGHGDTIGSVTSGHLWHESAAWNVAIGAALAWLAWRRTRPAALLPVMTAFVAVLGLLTANDALAGRVDGERILSHSLILAGYALLLVMNLPKLRDVPPPTSSRQTGGRWSLGKGDDDEGPTARVYPFPVRVSTANTNHVKPRRSA